MIGLYAVLQLHDRYKPVSLVSCSDS